MDSFTQTAVHRVPWPEGERDVRVVRLEGDPWFVAADVCRALGLFINKRGELNVTLALAPVATCDKRLARIETSPGTFRPYTRYMLISPRGLMQLLAGSRGGRDGGIECLPQAFQTMIDAAFAVMTEVVRPRAKEPVAVGRQELAAEGALSRSA